MSENLDKTLDAASGLLSSTVADASSLAEFADVSYSLRRFRLNLQAEVDKITEVETLLKDKVLEVMGTLSITQVSGVVGSIRVAEKSVATVKDWDLFLAHVAEKKDFGLLMRRINSKPALDRLADGESIAGVEELKLKSLSITKSKT